MHPNTEKNCKALDYEKDRLVVLDQCKNQKLGNKERLSEYYRKRYLEKKFHILTVCKKYREDNKDVIRKKYIAKYGSVDYQSYHRTYTKNKYHTDPIYKIISLHRTRLRSALKSQNATKLVSKSIDLFGCSPVELKSHLENQLHPEWSWGNHGAVWHIDHIKPLSKFNLSDDAEQKKAFHYTNLQPMLKRDNLVKRNNFQET